ncbi:MAG TPA: hypothetical protein VHA78_04500 [Candidatus Peribacteraceae bacterium]|nr:hypothetical protein [Candidatus Peribacteraceae bacterium]
MQSILIVSVGATREGRYCRLRSVTALFRQYRLLRWIPVLLAVCPVPVFAQRTLNVDIGTQLSIWQIITRIITFLAGSVVIIAGAMFLVGAFMIVLSGAKEDYKQKGKDLMIGSLIGMGVVLGAYAILRTVSFFLG